MFSGWRDPIQSKEMKYVWLAASSTIKGESDLQKYEKARMLKGIVDKVREDYKAKIKTGPRSQKYSNKDRQIAVAIHLIDRFALRVGGEKDTDEEADTVGCCTLKVGRESRGREGGWGEGLFSLPCFLYWIKFTEPRFPLCLSKAGWQCYLEARQRCDV